MAPLVRPLRRKPAPPSAASSLMGLAVVRHVARSIGGEPLSSRPVARWVIAGAMLRPALQIALLPVRVVEAALGELAKAWRYVTVGVAPRRSR